MAVAQPSWSDLIAVTKCVQAVAGSISTGPSGSLESRTPTADPATATSTQFAVGLLRLLRRQAAPTKATSTQFALGCSGCSGARWRYSGPARAWRAPLRAQLGRSATSAASRSTVAGGARAALRIFPSASR